MSLEDLKTAIVALREDEQRELADWIANMKMEAELKRRIASRRRKRIHLF